MELNDLCMGCMTEKQSSQEVCPVCDFIEGTAPDSPLFLPPRTVLENKYLIGRVLGQGGFGTTYLAWDLNLNVKLAIKEYFPQDLASRATGHSQVSAYSGSMGSQFEYGLDKFLQEARTLAQFEGHPNIVSVRDFFKSNGTAYFVMSYVEGITLKEHLANSGGKLPVEQARAVLMPVMDALKEVHEVNVLHRDISPDNIFINKKGQVILIDFGAARQAIGEKGRSLSIILKPGYAPEEQYRTKGVQGPWTDIYAIAATYYHLITGHQPPEALERLIDDPLEKPSVLGAAIEVNEEVALLKALAVRAEDRFQSVREFQAELLGFETEKNYTAFPIPIVASESAIEQAWPETRKSSLKIIIAIIAAVVVIGGGVAAYGLGLLSGDGSEQALQEPEIVEPDENQIVSDIAVGQVEEQPEDNVVDETEMEESQEDVNIGFSETGDNAEPVSAQNPQPEPQPQPEPAPSEGQTAENLSYEGGLYSGQLRNGLPHGQGKWIHPGGLSYMGEFTDGSVTGYGTMFMPSGDVYVGMVVRGIPNGPGRLTKVDGSVVEGNWVNGNLQ